jgi:DNA-binding MarR family transcriptional regulator
VLLVVDQHQEIDQTAVAQLMSLDKNTVTDVLRRLRSRGLIFSRQDPIDGRRMLTRLSDAGRRALRAATPAVRAIQDRLLESLRVRERHTFLELLRKAAYLGRADDWNANATRGSTASGQPTSGQRLRLDMAPGHLIRRMQQLHTMYWFAEVSSELTSPQFSLLLVLFREAPMSQGPLGERCSLDRATAAEVLSRMYRRGLVARIRDTVDGRRYKLTLSASGHTTLHTHIAGVLSVQRRLMEPLSQQERVKLTTSMAKVGHVAP